MSKVANQNNLFELIKKLIICGFRGSAQEIINNHLEEYLNCQRINVRNIFPSLEDCYKYFQMEDDSILNTLDAHYKRGVTALYLYLMEYLSDNKI